MVASYEHGFLNLDDKTDTLSRNIGKELPLYAAEYSITLLTSYTSRRTPEITNGYEPCFHTTQGISELAEELPAFQVSV